MRKVNIHEAKTQLSRLIASGEEIVIARYGEPVARLVPIKAPTSRRTPGSEGIGTFFVPIRLACPRDVAILRLRGGIAGTPAALVVM